MDCKHCGLETDFECETEMSKNTTDKDREEAEVLALAVVKRLLLDYDEEPIPEEVEWVESEIARFRTAAVQAEYDHAKVFHTRLVAAQEALIAYPGIVTRLVQGYGVDVNEKQIDAWLRNVIGSNIVREILDHDARIAKEATRDLQEVIDDFRRLTKELDDALNEAGAAKVPSLCDIVSQVRKLGGITGITEEATRKERERVFVILNSTDLMEALADDEHNRWSGQARTALDEMTDERRERWDRLSRMAYEALDERNKELDRMQVRERIEIIRFAILSLSNENDGYNRSDTIDPSDGEVTLHPQPCSHCAESDDHGRPENGACTHCRKERKWSIGSDVKTASLTGVDRIAAERKRQITKEGWTPEHDDQHYHGELAEAACAYALGRADLFPKRLSLAWWKTPRKPNGEIDRIRELVKAGALIAAEIDRLNRIAEKE